MNRTDSPQGGRALRTSPRPRPAMELALLFVLAAAGQLRADSACETVAVKSTLAKKEILATGLNRPYQLSIYEKERKIFFSYNTGKNEEDTFEIGYIERGKTNVTAIQGVPNGFATAVDQERGVVYLGGSSGIYEYHLNKKKYETLEKIIHGHNIWYMFFKEHLYFIEYPSQKLYKYNTSEAEAVPEHQTHVTEKIYQYLIDKDGDEFVTNASGLFRIERGSSVRTRLAAHQQFRGAALNNQGHAYFCGDHSIYTPITSKKKLEQIASIRNIFGITFDSEDNIIYADPDKIVNLVPGTCK